VAWILITVFNILIGVFVGAGCGSEYNFLVEIHKGVPSMRVEGGVSPVVTATPTPIRFNK
jgi:hypothetical protein